MLPCRRRGGDETYAGPSHFVHPDDPRPLTYTDNSPELKDAIGRFGWRHDTATPYRPQTNGVAERAMRTVKEGATSVLAQVGLEPCTVIGTLQHGVSLICAT